MSARILVVDDEKDLVNLLRYNLMKEGYTVSCAYDGSSVLPMVWSSPEPPSLIILDLMLPDRSGYDICRDLKADNRTRHIPIIMLTARSSEYNRVTGFECGVDDYVIKPFSPKELVLRVKALLARTAPHRDGLGPPTDKATGALPIGTTVPTVASQFGQNAPPSQDGRVIQMGKLRIDPDGFRVFVNEVETALTQTEFEILLALAQEPNRVRTREQLLTAVWQEEAELVLDRSVDAQVKRLRAKLGEARDMVETVRGLGYRLSMKSPQSAENG